MNWTHIRTSLGFLLLLLLLCTSLAAAAQAEEPTDRPFPGGTAATATTPAEPTDRPFPGGAAAATASPQATDLPASTEETEEESTPELTVDEALATAAAAEEHAVELQAEIGRLNTELEAAQSDNGATTFALVIIVVGVVLALGVFFGLRRSKR